MSSFSFTSDRRAFFKFLTGATIAAPVLATIPETENISGLITVPAKETVITSIPHGFSCQTAIYDIQPWVLFDTIFPEDVPQTCRYGQDLSAFRLFEKPDFTWTHRNNISLSCRLPTPEEFAIRKIFVLANDCDLKLIQRWKVRFILGSKVYLERLVFSMAQSDNPLGVYLDAKAFNGSDPHNVGLRNTIATPEHAFDSSVFDEDLVILMGQHFYAEVQPDERFHQERARKSILWIPEERKTERSALSGPVTICLDGWAARGVQ